MADESNEKDEFVRESLEDWTPRFIANGLDANDLERIIDRIESWSEWCEVFGDVGSEHTELAEAAEERGDMESAGEHFTQASMYYHFGSHVWHEDEAVREDAHQKAVELFERGGRNLTPPVQRIEAPYREEGFDVPGYLTVPDENPTGESRDSPLVVLLPGLDSIKEELYSYTPRFCARGVATLAVDGAGQGETWFEHAMSPEYHELISAVLDYIEEKDPDGVDTSRVGVMGVSLGGFYAPYSAAHDDRFDACVGISGMFSVGPVSKYSSDLLKEQFQWACKADSLVEVDDITEEMSMRDCIGDLTCPSLMLTGAQDTIVYPEETERITSHAPNGEYKLYEEGNHVCNNIPYKYQPYVSDWLRSKLT